MIFAARELARAAGMSHKRVRLQRRHAFDGFGAFSAGNELTWFDDQLMDGWLALEQNRSLQILH